MGWKPLTKAYVRICVDGDYVPVASVRLHEDGLFETMYDESWLETGFALDPLHLPLRRDSFDTERLPSVFSDTLPDEWGRRVMLATHRQAPSNPLEWAISSGHNGVGALLFSASRTRFIAPVAPPEFSDIIAIADTASAVDRRDLVSDAQVVKLLWPGSSLGGARPKATVRDHGTEWLAKFGRASDVVDTVLAEHATLTMARDAGIATVDHELATLPDDRHVLLVRRFDRDDHGHRRHYLSAHTLLGIDRVTAEAPYQDFSYAGIATRIRKVSGAARTETAELYRRMVFNIMVGNTDDHLRNHGFLHMRDQTYQLSPAFDIVPVPGSVAVQAIGVGVDGKASTLANAVSRAGAFGLDGERAVTIVKEVADVVANAKGYFQAVGMAPADVQVLERMCQRTLRDAERLTPKASAPTAPKPRP